MNDDEARAALVNANRPRVADASMTEYMANESLSLTATNSPAKAYTNADFVIVAAQTDCYQD